MSPKNSLDRLKGLYDGVGADSSSQDEAAAEEASTEETAAGTQESNTATEADETGEQPKKKTPRPKFTVYLEPEEAAEFRGAAHRVFDARGYRSLNEWMLDVLRRDLHQLRDELNGGEPFPPADPYEKLTRGRPLGR